MFEKAKEALQIEADSILELLPRIDDHFGEALKMILHCRGRIIVTGMGKSGIIGRKIAATLASTGTPAFFLHPAEGIHGDLGMVTEHDVVLALSNSGETGEVLNILPSIRRIGARIIAMVGNPESTLAKNADIVLNVGVKREACPLGLAPTSSTTAALAFGDALAMELLSARHFTPEEFAIFHPGGSLGRKLLLTVDDVMHKGDENPVVHADISVKDALFIITDKGVGAVSVVDDDQHLQGLLTDGDIRRGIAQGFGLPEPARVPDDDQKSQDHPGSQTGRRSPASHGIQQTTAHYRPACSGQGPESGGSAAYY